MFYSFLGFLFEVAFARLTRNPKRDRKCRLLLPLCPVYGLGACGLLLLPEGVRERPVLLFVCAAALCTAVEYAVGLFYEKALGAPFWDYRALPLNLGGKVCLPFSLLWGGMTVLLAPLLQPFGTRLAQSAPHWLAAPELSTVGSGGGALPGGQRADLLPPAHHPAHGRPAVV